MDGGKREVTVTFQIADSAGIVMMGDGPNVTEYIFVASDEDEIVTFGVLVVTIEIFSEIAVEFKKKSLLNAKLVVVVGLVVISGKLTAATVDCSMCGRIDFEVTIVEVVAVVVVVVVVVVFSVVDPRFSLRKRSARAHCVMLVSRSLTFLPSTDLEQTRSQSSSM